MGKFVPTGYVFTEYVEIIYDWKAETEKAVLISDGDMEGWIPKSCIEDGYNIDLEAEDIINVAKWFAEKEGWI